MDESSFLCSGRKPVNDTEIQKIRTLMDSDLVSFEAANRPLKRIKDVDGNPRNARLLNTSISNVLNDVPWCISKSEVPTKIFAKS